MRMTTTANTRRMWMNPPIVNEETRPSSHNTTSMIAMVSNIMSEHFARSVPQLFQRLRPGKDNQLVAICKCRAPAAAFCHKLRLSALFLQPGRRNRQLEPVLQYDS